jgi:hypothetical protein
MLSTISKVKLLLILGTISYFAFITSCSDDDDDAAKSDLVGLWTVTSAVVDASINEKTIKDYFIDELGFDEINATAAATLIQSSLPVMFIGSTINFKEDNTYISNFAGEPDDGTWSTDGNTITLDEGTIWEQTADIISLSPSMAKIGLSITEVEDIDDNPATPDVPIDMEVEMTLTK